jgi:hypothetical protein
MFYIFLLYFNNIKLLLQVFVIVLGIVLYNPKDIILEAKDKAEAIQQEYVTMLR